MRRNLFMVVFSMKLKKSEIVIRIGLFCIIFIGILSLMTEILKDKRVVGEYNPTTKVRGFYQEQKNSLDFVMIGSSQLYADISPAVIYRDYGFTSYDFCANEQPMWVSYYYMKESLKRQKPKAIILDVFTIYGADYEDEGVTHINLDDLPFSLNKLLAIKDSVRSGERIPYYFEIAKYHTTWQGLDQDKFKATFDYSSDKNKGYSPFVYPTIYESQAKEEVRLQNERDELPNKALYWLEKIKELAKKEQVDLILIKTPNGSADRQRLYNALADYIDANWNQEIDFIDMNQIFDGEAHINVLQAEIVSDYLGQYLKERYHGQAFSTKSEKVKNSFEESVLYFEGYKAQTEAILATKLNDYLQIAKKNPNLITMFAKIGGDAFLENMQNDLSAFGLRDEQINDSASNLVALFDDGKLTTYETGQGQVSAIDVTDDYKCSIKIKGEDGSYRTVVKINGFETEYKHIPESTALQVVLYDKVLDQTYESAYFDIEGNRITE